MKNCFECKEPATQIVEVKNRNGEIILLDLCPPHADGHRQAEAWQQVINELWEAEMSGNTELAAQLDEEQKRMFHDLHEFPDVINA